MRFFISFNSDHDLQSDRVKYQVTPHYVELEIPSQSYQMVLYVLPRDRTSVFVATCWGSLFDQEPANLNHADSCKAIFETCPNLAHRLTNGISDRLQEGALIRLKDIDRGDTKWFLAAVIDNVDCSRLDQILNEQTHPAIGQIMHQSFELLNELYEKQPLVFNAVTQRIGQDSNPERMVGATAALSQPD